METNRYTRRHSDCGNVTLDRAYGNKVEHNKVIQYLLKSLRIQKQKILNDKSVTNTSCFLVKLLSVVGKSDKAMDVYNNVLDIYNLQVFDVILCVVDTMRGIGVL